MPRREDICRFGPGLPLFRCRLPTFICLRPPRGRGDLLRDESEDRRRIALKEDCFLIGTLSFDLLPLGGDILQNESRRF